MGRRAVESFLNDKCRLTNDKCKSGDGRGKGHGWNTPACLAIACGWQAGKVRIRRICTDKRSVKISCICVIRVLYDLKCKMSINPASDGLCAGGTVSG